MPCPICGAIIVDEVIPAAAKLAVHRLLKHEPPAVQFVAVLIFTALGVAAWKAAFD